MNGIAILGTVRVAGGSPHARWRVALPIRLRRWRRRLRRWRRKTQYTYPPTRAQRHTHQLRRPQTHRHVDMLDTEVQGGGRLSPAHVRQLPEICPLLGCSTLQGGVRLTSEKQNTPTYLHTHGDTHTNTDAHRHADTSTCWPRRYRVAGGSPLSTHDSFLRSDPCWAVLPCKKHDFY